MLVLYIDNPYVSMYNHGMETQTPTPTPKKMGRPPLYGETMRQLFPISIPASLVAIYEQRAQSHHAGNLTSAIREGLQIASVILRDREDA